MNVVLFNNSNVHWRNIQQTSEDLWSLSGAVSTVWVALQNLLYVV